LRKNLPSNGRIQVLNVGSHVEIMEKYRLLHLPKRRYTMTPWTESLYSDLGTAKSRREGIPIFLIKVLGSTRTDVLGTNTIHRLATPAARLFFLGHPEDLH
jgi:hypothetical protein